MKKILISLLFMVAAFSLFSFLGKIFAPPPRSRPPASYSLITEPDDGIAPIIAMIQSARRSIDVVMYTFQDRAIEGALASAATRGVSVRVLLNHGYYGAKPGGVGPNEAAYGYLASHGVAVRWTPARFALTHQKTMVIDRTEAAIMTFNFTPQYYASSRDFGIIDRDLADVSAIEKTFAADWNDAGAMDAPPGSHLVWSPGSEGAMLSLIASAKKSLKIYNEEMADAPVTRALAAAAARGVDVEIVMTYQSSWKRAFQEIARAGGHVEVFARNAARYIHAKMILVDGTTAFIGSENFSSGSLYDNRELGIVLTDPAIIASLARTFAADWSAAQPLDSIATLPPP